MSSPTIITGYAPFMGKLNVAYGSTGGLQLLGDTQGEITVTTGTAVHSGFLQKYGRIPLSDGIFVEPEQPVISIPFVSQAAADLAKQMPHLKTFENGGKTGVGARTKVRKLTADEVLCLVLIPIYDAVSDYETDMEDDPYLRIYPAVYCNGTTDFTYALPEGEDVFGDFAHTVEYVACQRLKDHADTAIPDGLRLEYMGALSAATGAPAAWANALPTPAQLFTALGI